MSADDFEHLLHHFAVGPATVDDLKVLLRDSVNYRTAPSDAVAWLADVLGPERFARAAVEAGVLVRPTFDYAGATFRAGFYPDTEVDDVHHFARVKMTIDPDAIPLYRIGADRG